MVRRQRAWRVAAAMPNVQTAGTLNSSTAANEALQASIAVLQAKVDAMAADNAAPQAKVDSLTAENTKLRCEVARKAEENAALQKELYDQKCMYEFQMSSPETLGTLAAAYLEGEKHV